MTKKDALSRRNFLKLTGASAALAASGLQLSGAFAGLSQQDMVNQELLSL